MVMLSARTVERTSLLAARVNRPVPLPQRTPKGITDDPSLRRDCPLRSSPRFKPERSRLAAEGFVPSHSRKGNARESRALLVPSGQGLDSGSSIESYEARPSETAQLQEENRSSRVSGLLLR